MRKIGNFLRSRLPKRVKTIKYLLISRFNRVWFSCSSYVLYCTNPSMRKWFRSTSHTSLAYRHFRRATASTRKVVDEPFLLLRVTSLIPLPVSLFEMCCPLEENKRPSQLSCAGQAADLLGLVHCLAGHLSFADKLHYLVPLNCTTPE